MFSAVLLVLDDFGLEALGYDRARGGFLIVGGARVADSG
jgi:hypothetical protein